MGASSLSEHDGERSGETWSMSDSACCHYLTLNSPKLGAYILLRDMCPSQIVYSY
jgi:hypothetical protein